MQLSDQEVHEVRERFGSPVYVYCEKTLRQLATAVLQFPHAYGFTPRYAMKALSNGAILKILLELGISIDASSGYEVERAIHYGFPPSRIQLTSQELPHNLEDLVRKGVLFNACSLRQLDIYGRLFPGTEVCIRVNPGVGSGHDNKTSVGGPGASFGIWHEYLEEAKQTASRHGLDITRLHTHIGSGSDPQIWIHAAGLVLNLTEAHFPNVHTVSLGGGFHVGRMSYEPSVDLHLVGTAVRRLFESFYQRTGRALHLEVEPGTYIVANAGSIVASVTDVVDTGHRGHRFIKTDTGMTEILRPMLYGAQHPIRLVPGPSDAHAHAHAAQGEEYLVVGHCCESGDLLTPQPHNPEGLGPRVFATHPAVGDAVVVGGTGAYCSSMAAANYNSFLRAPEVLRRADGSWALIRRRQRLEQLWADEVDM